MSDNKKLLMKRPILIAKYQSLFKTHDGKSVLYDLMKGNFIMRSTFHENPHVMAFQEGQREAILRILKTLKIDHEKMAKEIEEQEDREARDG